ncbi:MAG: PD-(D/E)XK nuclease domain-containing protein [Lachnospiraceae bacterium]|nr:PD-(D/E)XK nuclease domain-containing protein [Lachnospiraceae bacterium]
MDVKSNTEMGDGFADIFVADYEKDLGIVIEIKYAQDGNLEKACDNALEQIFKKRYDDSIDVRKILRYGIGFYRKRCRIKGVSANADIPF